MKKVLVALSLVSILALTLIAIGAFIPSLTKPQSEHLVTFELTASNLVITNNGTTPLSAFNFTVNTLTVSNHYGQDQWYGSLEGCTNATIEPNMQVSVLPGSYDHNLGLYSSCTFITGVTISYEGITHNFSCDASGQLYVEF